MIVKKKAKEEIVRNIDFYNISKNHQNRWESSILNNILMLLIYIHILIYIARYISYKVYHIKIFEIKRLNKRK